MNITHNLATQRFETTIEGHTAYLSYDKVDDTTLDYNHTIVPSELGGRGIGTALVKHALDYVKAQGLKVVPSCSFVRHFISKDSDYADLVAKNA